MTSVECAMAYLCAGLSVLPAIRAQKRPAVGQWKTWSERLPNEYEIKAWFANNPDAFCIVTGKVSGNLECQISTITANCMKNGRRVLNLGFLADLRSKAHRRGDFTSFTDARVT